MNLNNQQQYIPELPWSMRDLSKAPSKIEGKCRQISDLDVTIDELYEGKKQISIHIEGSPYSPHIVMKGRDGRPDFKISSFGLNIWARSKKGVNYEKYRSLADVKNQAIRIIRKYIADKDKVIYFSVSSDVLSL